MRYVLLLDGTDGSVAHACNTLPQVEGGGAQQLSRVAAATMAPAAPAFFVAGIGLQPGADHSDASSQLLARGWNTLTAAGANISRVCGVIAESITASHRTSNDGFATVATSGPGSQQELSAMSRISTQITAKAAKRICMTLQTLFDRLKRARAYEIDVIWLLNSARGGLSDLFISPASSTIMVAIFGALSELICLPSNRARLPSSSAVASSVSSTHITFMSPSLQKQSLTETIPSFVLAWADLLGTRQLVSHISTCSAATIRAQFFDPGRLWRGTIAGTLQQHRLDLSSETLTKTSHLDNFYVDDFLDLLESKAQTFPLSHSKASGSCKIALDGIYFRSKMEAYRWPVDIVNIDVGSVVTNGADVALCGLISLPDATNLVLSHVMFRRRGEIVMGIRPTAKGTEPVDMMRQWSSRKNSAMLLRIQNSISDPGIGQEDTCFLVCFPYTATEECNTVLEFHAIVMTKIPEKMMPGAFQDVIAGGTQQDGSESTGRSIGIAMRSGSSANESISSDSVCQAVTRLPLLSGRDIATQRGSFSLLQCEELSIKASLGLQVPATSSVSIGTNKDVVKVTQHCRSRRRSRRELTTSASASSFSSSIKLSLSSHDRVTGYRRQPQAIPLHNVLSRAAKNKGILMQSELVDARRYHHAWDEIEARLARLHAHMSSIKNLQIYMDVDWVARVLDDGIIDNNDNTNNLVDPPSLEGIESTVNKVSTTRKRKASVSNALQNGRPKKTGRAEAAMATARKKTRDHQRGFMKKRGIRRKHGGSSLSSTRTSSSGGSGTSFSSVTPGKPATDEACALGAIPTVQEKKNDISSRVNRNYLPQPSSSLPSILPSPGLLSSSQTRSKESLRILSVFDSKTGKISDNYYRSLPRRPLLRCNMTTARLNGGRDTAVKSIAVAVSEREFCLQYDELDHGVEWWQPETSRAEEKLRRGLRISQSKGGQLTVALKTSGSVAFATAVPKTPIFSPNGTSKLKRSTRSSEGERRSLPSFIYPNASPGNTKNDSSFAREDYPKPLSAATGDSRYSHGSQLFVLHEQLLQSLVPSSCCSDKFSRLVSFAVHMTQVVLDELNKVLGTNGKITEEIVSAVASRNIEHAIAMLLHPPAATTGLD